MNLKGFFIYLFKERLGYYRPSVVTPEDHALRDFAERHLSQLRHDLGRDIGVLDVNLDLYKFGATAGSKKES